MTTPIRSSADELLTGRQVADLLQVAPGTIENWRHAGRGPAYLKIGPSRRSPVRYRRADVDAWIAEMSRRNNTD